MDRKSFIKGVILSCVAGSFLSLSGCKTVEKQAKYKDMIVVDVFDSLANYQGIQSGWFAKIVEDKFNMKLNIIAPNVSGGGDSLYQNRVASGKLGDLIICKGTDNNLQNLVDADLIQDISPYLEGTDLMKYEKAILSLNESLEGDAIYGIPSVVSSESCMEPSDATNPTFGPYLRYDIYGELGYPEIKNLDDLLTVLKEMQKLHPVSENGNKTYAFSFFKDWDGNMMVAAKQPACFYGYDEEGFVLAKADGSDYQDIADENSLYQKILRLYFEANQLGLVDPDSITQNYSDVFQKYEQGDILYSPWPWLGKSAYNTLENRENGKGFMFVPIKDMEILSIGCNPYGDWTSVIAIGADAKDPERLADFINWLYTSEGIYANAASKMNGTAGPEGLCWENTEKGPVFTEIGLDVIQNGDVKIPEEWGSGTWKSGISQLNINTVSLTDKDENENPYSYTLWEEFRKLEDTKLEQLWREQMDAESPMDYLRKNDKLLVSPGTVYPVAEETNEILAIRSQCKKVIVDTSWKMVFAKDEQEFDRLQKEMKEKLDSLGYESVLEHDMNYAKKKIEEKLKAADQEG